MTPTQILALVRDLVVLVALGFIVYVLIKFGEDRVTAKDMKAVQTQLTNNASTQARWQTEASHAIAQLHTENADTARAIGQQHAPIIVRIPASGSSLPAAPAAAAGQPACPGGPAAGPGENPQPAGVDVDIRAQVNAFELRYEEALANCRSVLAQWPR